MSLRWLKKKDGTRVLQELVWGEYRGYDENHNLIPHNEIWQDIPTVEGDDE